jgi:hypothetical protein
MMKKKASVAALAACGIFDDVILRAIRLSLEGER